MTVCFFVGNDVTSHMILNGALKVLAANKIRSLVYLTSQNCNPKAPERLKKLFYFERSVLNNVVYPALDAKVPFAESRLNSPTQLLKLYSDNLIIKNCFDVNSSDVLSEMSRMDVQIGVSLRCYQKFGVKIINYFSRKGRRILVNLHPGILPEYRGVLTFVRAMYNRDNEAGFTLHEVNERWDAGPIISISKAQIDYGRSVVMNMLKQSSGAEKILTDFIVDFFNGVPYCATPQNEDKAAYYTHATEAELDSFERKNIFLLKPEEIHHFFLNYASVEIDNKLGCDVGFTEP